MDQRKDAVAKKTSKIVSGEYIFLETLEGELASMYFSCAIWSRDGVHMSKSNSYFSSLTNIQ